MKNRKNLSEKEIQQRIREMKENDKETGEYPNATDEDYRKWAIEEVEANLKGSLAIQNDIARWAFVGIRLVLTSGVMLVEKETRAKVIRAVQKFTDFNKDNDPYGEHDFGKVKVDGVNYFWKIDYYDKSYSYHSPDKHNPELTKRVLTIMRADEY